MNDDDDILKCDINSKMNVKLPINTFNWNSAYIRKDGKCCQTGHKNQEQTREKF